MSPCRRLRCAIYTRVSTDHGLEQDFNSLDAQREACRAYVKSQAHEGWSLVREEFADGGFSGGSLERPALQALLAAVRARRIDVVVVYKVDRLTRSLADFAKLVELFDQNGVTFVSVTQSFNTTTSMGRLTLNVLLSFAQFEREVTSERIRDKIAASKRRGLWVGGMVPLGYESRDKKLVVVDEEAERVRLVFRLYRELGSLDAVMTELRRRGVVTKVRRLKNGRIVGGIAFTRGPLAYLLRNRFYLGEVAFKGEVCPGEHPAILDRELFEAVQERLFKQRRVFVNARTGSKALLLGKLFDDRGNRMTPAHANKKGVRYRYYVSSALAQARPTEAGSAPRVSAPAIEAAVLDALRRDRPQADLSQLIALVERVILHRDRIEIALAPPAHSDDGEGEREADRSGATAIRVPWAGRNGARRREIVPPSFPQAQRPMRAETRATLVRNIALGRRWLDEFVAGAVAGPEAIAVREGCSRRHVAMMISLAFLAPDLVKSAIEGSLPAGIGVSRLVDPPIAWGRQRQMIGLRADPGPST